MLDKVRLGKVRLGWVRLGLVMFGYVRLGFDEAWDFHGSFRKMLKYQIS